MDAYGYAWNQKYICRVALGGTVIESRVGIPKLAARYRKIIWRAEFKHGDFDRFIRKKQKVGIYDEGVILNEYVRGLERIKS